MGRTPTAGIDYTNRDYEAFRELLIAGLQRKMPEYTDTSQTDAGIVIIEGLANGLDILSMYLDTIANDVVLATTQDRKIAVMIAKILGYTPYSQTTSLTKQVFVLNEVKDEDVLIPKGTAVATVSDSEDVDPLIFETVADFVIPAGNLGNEQDEETGLYLYTVDVAQGESIDDEILGSSNGTPYQTFTLAFQNVLIDTLSVYVDEEGSIEEWTQVDTFIDREIDGTSRVYTVSMDDYDNCIIEFGNGVKGMIPPQSDDGISCDYRVGGGVASNVAANVITELEDDLEFVDETFNPEASYELGHDQETLEEIKMNAPANFRVRGRLVTLQDYEDAFMIENTDFYGIYRIQAIEDVADVLKVNLYVQMRAGYSLTDELIAQMGLYLDDMIIVGTKYAIYEHTDTVLDISANLIVDKDYVQSEVEALVYAFISSYFADEEFTFEDSFINSDLEQEVMGAIDGIITFRITSPNVNMFEPNSAESIIKLGTVTLNTTGGQVTT